MPLFKKNVTTRQKVLTGLFLALTLFISSMSYAIIRGDGMNIKAEGFDTKIELEMRQVKR